MHPQHTQVHPQAEQESIFMTFLQGGGDLEVYLVDWDLERFRRLLRGRRLKKVVNFFEEKSDKILTTPTTYDVHLRLFWKRVVIFLLALIELFARCYRWGAKSEYQ